MFVYRQELPVIAKNSLVNCHVLGMDSVMFDNTPGKRVRAYITQDYHTLHQNGFAGETLSLAIHTHHCDIEIDAVVGFPRQVIPVRHPQGDEFAPWKYRSEITEGNGGFARVDGPVERFKLETYTVKLGDPWFMGAKDLHSFYVDEGETAAWMVREFREDPTYDSTCWSDADLTKFDKTNLYQPMDVEYLTRVLDQMKIHII